MNVRALFNTLGTRSYSLPIVILYVTSGCNLKCVMCSYRDPHPNELSLAEIRDLAEDLRALGLRHIVYSGGEPLVRKDFPEIVRCFSGLQVRQTILTNGLLLEKRMREVDGFFDEVIVSIDGPNPLIHNSIRGVEAFEQIVKGLRSLLSIRFRPRVSIRTVVQRSNFRHLGRMIDWARDLGVDRISFLSADTHSGAFHRDSEGQVPAKDRIFLNREEAIEFRSIMTELLTSHRPEFESSFVSENASKMFHLVEYFEAVNGLTPFPPNRCNAPSVSAVITSSGDLLPCYFLPSYGNVRSGSLSGQLNGDDIRRTRRDVRSLKLAQCQKCVCTLRVSPAAALADRF